MSAIPTPTHLTHRTSVARASAAELRGVACSAGRVTGRARILREGVVSEPLVAGEIIVCRASSPVLGRLLATAGGVIVETGGALSNFATVAREYGIPAVIVRDATARIRDGQTITIDGERGIVSLSA